MRPVFVGWTEFRMGKMADHSRHGHLTSAPRMAKVELERIILDILVASTVL